MKKLNKIKSDFLFVFPERKTGGVYGGCKYYLGAAYIISYHGYRSEEVDFFLSDNTLSWRQTAQLICDSAGIGIGFTVYDSNYGYVKHLACIIKKIRPDLIIACGGPSATFSTERIMEDCKAIDICILGEGELIFDNLYREHYRPSAWENIPGLVIRKGNKILQSPVQIHSCYSNKNKADCKEIVSPYLAGIIPPSEAARVGVFTSKGCPFACTYCSFSAVSHRKIYFYSESMVIEELKLICQWFEKTQEQVIIDILDDNFAASMRRCKRILKKLGEFRPLNINFAFGARPDGRQDNEFYELAKKAGVIEINFGLEAADAKILSLVKKVRDKKGKDYSAEDAYLGKIREAVQKTEDHGINATVSIIIGLPGDTREKAEKTLEFIKMLPVSTYYHNILNIFDGTELARTHDDFGIKREPIEGTPFLKTIHGYDVNNFPILPKALIVKTFVNTILYRLVMVVSGVVNDSFIQDIPFVFIDFSRHNRKENLDQIPAGSFFLLLNEIETKMQLEQNHIGFNFLEKTSAGREIKPGFSRGQIHMPSIIFPEDDMQIDPDRSYIEFFNMAPEDDFPVSLPNHWKLPFGACGLLKGKCPVKGSRLQSDMNTKGICIYFPMEQEFSIPECETCEKNQTCPKCSYLLKLYPETYCEFHKSGKSGKLQVYLSAHSFALRSDTFDMTQLPAIQFEDFNLPDENSSVLRVEDQFSVVKW